MKANIRHNFIKYFVFNCVLKFVLQIVFVIGTDRVVVFVTERNILVSINIHLWQSLDLPKEDWTLHLLLEPQAVSETVRSYRLAAAGVWMTLAFLLLYLAQRRKTRRVEQRSRNELSGWSRSAPASCAPPRTNWCMPRAWPRWGRCPRRWHTRSISR